MHIYICVCMYICMYTYALMHVYLNYIIVYHSTVYDKPTKSVWPRGWYQCGCRYTRDNPVAESDQSRSHLPMDKKGCLACSINTDHSHRGAGREGASRAARACTAGDGMPRGVCVCVFVCLCVCVCLG